MDRERDDMRRALYPPLCSVQEAARVPQDEASYQVWPRLPVSFDPNTSLTSKLSRCSRRPTRPATRSWRAVCRRR